MELESRSVHQLQADVISDEYSMEQFSNLLDASFFLPKGCHYFDDFPVWDSKYGVYPLLRIGVFHDKKLVSAAAVRVGFLNPQAQSPVSVAIIGAVVTDPQWRGMGLASRT